MIGPIYISVSDLYLRMYHILQARQVQLKSLYDQMDEMNKNLKGMAKLKHDLHEKSDEFRRDLVSLLVGRSSVRANDLSQVIDNVVDATKIMSSIYEEQGNADDHIVQISADYKLMVSTYLPAIVIWTHMIYFDFSTVARPICRRTSAEVKSYTQHYDRDN